MDIAIHYTNLRHIKLYQVIFYIFLLIQVIGFGIKVYQVGWTDLISQAIFFISITNLVLWHYLREREARIHLEIELEKYIECTTQYMNVDTRKQSC